MKYIYSPILKSGDVIRVIAPAGSGKTISLEQKQIAVRRFKDMGISITFGKNIYENNEFGSSTVKSRIYDLHSAFADKEVDAIIAIRGGFNSNELLNYIDWDLIKSNPKIFCGFSDITVLHNAIYRMTGLITYHGPNFSSFGQKLNFDYSLEYFKKCLLEDYIYKISPSIKWSADEWWKKQNERKLLANKGYQIINYGKRLSYEGIIIGGNISSFNLLQGTKFFPDLEKSLLFIEDDELVDTHIFNRYLESILQQKNSDKIEAIIIGRFQPRSNISENMLRKIIASRKQLIDIPVIYGADFGHTDPQFTFPIGGTGRINFIKGNPIIQISKH